MRSIFDEEKGDMEEKKKQRVKFDANKVGKRHGALKRRGRHSRKKILSFSLLLPQEVVKEEEEPEEKERRREGGRASKHTQTSRLCKIAVFEEHPFRLRERDRIWRKPVDNHDASGKRFHPTD